jgi:hypothetical protein
MFTKHRISQFIFCHCALMSFGLLIPFTLWVRRTGKCAASKASKDGAGQIFTDANRWPSRFRWPEHHQNCSSGNAEKREANVAAGGSRGRNEWNLVNTYSHGQSGANSIGPKVKQEPRADDRNLAQHWFLEKTLIYFHVGIQTQV